MKWAFTIFLLTIISAAVLSGCSKTGIPECDYTPGKIKGVPVNDCPGIVYFDHSESKCQVRPAGRGETCPESAFKVDTSVMLNDCLKSAKNAGDADYCEFRVAERTVNDALKLCQEKCEGQKQ